MTVQAGDNMQNLLQCRKQTTTKKPTTVYLSRHPVQPMTMHAADNQQNSMTVHVADKKQNYMTVQDFN